MGTCFAMCLDFKKIDIDRVSKKMRDIPEPSIDPIFGSKPLIPQLWSSLPKWHGNLITASLLEFIRATPGWEGRKEFQFLPNKKTKKMFFDNLVINRSLNLGIVIECKRSLDTQPDDAITRIKGYQQTIALHQNELLRACKLKQPASVVFCVFDAYGPRQKSFNFPIIYPEDLKTIFGSCVFGAWKGFEKTFAEHLEALEFEVSQEHKTELNDWPNLEELKELSNSEDECYVRRESILSVLNRT